MPPKHRLYGVIPQKTIRKVIKKKSHKILTSAGIKRTGWKA
jgi:hypothetical protein